MGLCLTTADIDLGPGVCVPRALVTLRFIRTMDTCPYLSGWHFLHPPEILAPLLTTYCLSLQNFGARRRAFICLLHGIWQHS
ncbi:hypothetical protein AVEN_177525-1 [Araneus ventricosus]|uniref:Uncharacterized protein n=1 Tax=Araneus ventricosus TaxID=182803 RepID=A0A4Y2GH29_ARAVE|nr:hypothetical protein AVEN_241018-1 [Araneus ventricosus]GBM52045.1 hypothetical protein AVEN_177525-1 [Araneus ventricosus]